MDKTLQLIAYLEGTLSSEEKKSLQREMEKDPDLQIELEKLEELYATMEANEDITAPESIRFGFDELLESEKKKQESKKLWFSWGRRIAAGIALVAVGVWVGLSIQNNDEAGQQQITELKKEIESNRQLILNAMEQPAASQRFIAVNASENIQKPDQEVIDALVKVMNDDKNTNVRLAAVRALSRYAQEENVKKELISALLTQSDPLVQVALIDLLVELGEKRVVPTLDRLIKTDTTLETVKDEAYWAKMKLS